MTEAGWRHLTPHGNAAVAEMLLPEIAAILAGIPEEETGTAR